MKKTIAMLLSILLIVSFAVGCGNNGPSTNKNTETGEYIIQNGKTQYQVVYPHDGGSDIVLAISELNLFMNEATGVKFNAVPDTSVTYTANSRYISIGDTSLIEAAGVEFSDELSSSGTHIVTKDKSLFLYGETELSSLYAVYDFLEDVINWDYFGLESYYVDTDVKNIPLKNYDEVNIPDFKFRSTSYGWQISNPIYGKRMRLTHHFGQMPEVKGYQVHNSFGYVEDYIGGHESYWYSDDGTQLCYTAHTSEEDRYTEGSEYLQLIEACTKTAISALKQYPDTRILTMTHQDVGTWCTCESCAAVKAEYGTNSALLVLFMNDLRAEIDKWFETDEGQQYYREVTLAFFAYLLTVEAPATLNANGVWEANKGYDGEPIKCADGVAVWYAPIDSDFMQSIYDSVNETTLNAIQGWGAVSNKLMLWFYSATFFDYMNFYDTFDYMQEYYQVAHDSGAIYMFDQAQYNVNETSFSWGVLKSYLNSKLAWNVDADYGALIEKWFDGYYGSVADSMKNLFDYQRVYFNVLKSRNVGYGGTRSCMIQVRSEFYPKAVLETWLDMYDEVYAQLKPLKKIDEELYETYCTRVERERLSVYYLYVKLYEGSTSSSTIKQYKLQFKDFVEKIGIQLYADGSASISSILSNWGMG